jgi:hypothetical protein
VKRIAILVIAATNQPVYRHYIASYWTELIRHVAANVPHIDVYMLTEHGRTGSSFAHIADAVIEDPNADVDQLVPEQYRTSNVPGILSKTIHAFDALSDDYEVFFRTNLSSMVMLSRFDRLVQSTADIGYSGGLVWGDALRDAVVHHGYVGAGQSVAHISELDQYPGNSFVSGSGFLLNKAEAKHLVEHRDQLRYDLPDDVAIGLMLEQCRVLNGFTQIIKPSAPISETVERVEATSATHLRLQHFPVERAMGLWRHVNAKRLWA